MNTFEILRDARSRIDRGGWAKGAEARDSWGAWILPSAAAASRWSAPLALHRDAAHSEAMRAEAFLERVAEGNLQAFNDKQGSVGPVLALFDRAISTYGAEIVNTRIEVIGGKVYGVYEYGMDGTAARRKLCWLLAGVSTADVTPGQPVSVSMSIWRWTSPTGLKREHARAPGCAEIDEQTPVPQPKVRKGTAVKWDGTHGELGAWMKATKKGWVPV